MRLSLALASFATLAALFLFIVVMGGDDHDATASGPVLRTVPEIGRCGEPVTLEGSGFEPHAALTIMQDHKHTREPLLTTEADAQGDVALTVAADALGECAPGWAYLLRADAPQGQPVIEAIYTIEPPGALAVEPQSGACTAPVSVTGDGFPPGAEVVLMAGGPGLIISNQVPLATTTADPAGRIATEVTFSPPLPPSCDQPGTIGLRAYVEGHAGSWRATYAHGP